MLKRSTTSVGPEVDRICTLGRPQVRMSSDEVKKAHEAADRGAGASSEPTIFAKILNKEIPANIIHEDDKVSPNCAPVLYLHHLTFIPVA